MTERVVVTGVGIVSALCMGGVESLDAALERSQPAPGPMAAALPADPSRRESAELHPATLSNLMEPAEARRLSRVSQLAVAAGRFATREAGLGELSRGVHLVVATEFGDLRSTEEFAAGYLARGVTGLSPLAFPNTVMNAMASAMAISLGLRGASITLNCRRVAGELAVARASAMVASGRAGVVLVGGVDEVHPLTCRMLGEFRRLSPLDGRDPVCRPYDQYANGAIRGEGATFLVLEALRSARERGARILGEIRGVAWQCGRRARTILAALDAARAAPTDIQWVYSSASGDPTEDAAQLAALRRAFPASRPAVTSLSPLAGEHAGLGALHVAAAMRTLRDGQLPGIATLQVPRPEAAGFAVGPGLHRAGRGPGLIHGVARRGDQVALVVAAA